MKCISCDNSLDYLVSPVSQPSIYLFVAGDDNLSVSDSPLSPLTPLSPSLFRSTPSPKVRPLVQSSLLAVSFSHLKSLKVRRVSGWREVLYCI